MNFYQFIIPRLNGKDIEKDFDYYLGLVKKGIAGFIIFGGKLEIVRQGISELQKEAERPLIIAADLERGLGQQIEGGTIFPPAMAIAAAITPPVPPLAKGGIKGGWGQVSGSRLTLLRKAFKAIAVEARDAGINTIFAPVLDINTNPKNPIISTRAFGEDAETVSFFGIEMIKALQANGIAACGKHFPGHGDTEIDSHIGLPLIKKDIQSLEKTELAPFRSAVKAGVKMIMLGHLKVPALDPSGIPVSLSEKAVRYLRDRMGFKGILITDAMNMGALTQDVIARSPEKIGTTWQSKNEIASLSARNDRIEERASLMALRAGVDLLLHPTDTERVVSYLQQRFSVQPPADPPRRTNGCQLSANTLFRKSLRLVRTQADSPRRATEIIYVNHPLKYKGFEFYRDKEGYSPLFVLRDSLGRVLYGAYVPLQSIEQKDGTYLYRSGSAVAPGSFNFPQDPQLPPVFSLQATYYPDKVKKRAGEIFFQARPIVHGKDTEGQEEKELFKGKAALGKTVKAGDFLLSMDEVRYWTSMKVIYRPGSVIIFSSFWLGLGGITLSVILKMAKGIEKEER